MRHSRVAPIALLLILTGTVARASQPLPIIVTYEMKRQREAETVERRDPKAFWVRQIMARLEDRKPVKTLGLKDPATVKVGFTLARDGTMASKTISKTSGVPAVDREALAMLDRAQPFPPMPEAMREHDLAFSLPLRFR